MAPEAHPDELLDLIAAVCDGEAEPAQIARLEMLLREDPDARWTYLRYVHLDGSLGWDQGAAAEHLAIDQLRRAAPAVETSPRAASTAAPERTPTFAPSLRQGRAPWAAWSAIAAALLIAAVLGGRFASSRKDAPAAAPFARLAKAIDAVWAAGDAPAEGQKFGPRTLQLQAGLARIDFDNGASVTLEGPAEFSILSVDQTVLQRGQLTTHVPAAAFGFRVDTPMMTVVDLGTSFGVAVDPDGSADLCIFEGDVVVAPNQRQSSSEKHWLKAGEAVRMNAGSKKIDRVDFSPKRFMRSWPVTFGVLDATGVVKFDPPGHPFKANDIEDDQHIIIIAERDRIELKDDLQVNIVRPGTFHGKPVVRERLKAGSAVRSYMLQFNPIGKANNEPFRLPGAVRFDGPIVGIITDSELLGGSDELLGASAPDDIFNRGLEASDAVTLSEDRRNLILDWKAGVGKDQIRVLVETPALVAP